MIVVKIVFWISVFMTWFGIVGPMMISADSDVLVLLWSFVTITGIVFTLTHLWRKYGKAVLRYLE